MLNILKDIPNDWKVIKRCLRTARFPLIPPFSESSELLTPILIIIVKREAFPERSKLLARYLSLINY
jgi:hypothetical protein